MTNWLTLTTAEKEQASNSHVYQKEKESRVRSPLIVADDLYATGARGVWERITEPWFKLWFSLWNELVNTFQETVRDVKWY